MHSFAIESNQTVNISLFCSWFFFSVSNTIYLNSIQKISDKFCLNSFGTVVWMPWPQYKFNVRKLFLFFISIPKGLMYIWNRIDLSYFKYFLKQSSPQFNKSIRSVFAHTQNIGQEKRSSSLSIVCDQIQKRLSKKIDHFSNNNNIKRLKQFNGKYDTVVCILFPLNLTTTRDNIWWEGKTEKKNGYSTC